MKNDTPEQPTELSKPVAILGLIAAVLLIAWISIKIVNLAPNTFTSLASISQSLESYKTGLSHNDEPLLVKNDLDTIESGKPLTISWEKDGRTGSYAFSYDCAEGVAVDIVDQSGLRSVTCETRYDVGDVDMLSVIVNSDKQTEAGLAYNISFIRANEASPVRTSEKVVTITNPTLASKSPEEIVLGETDSTDWRDDIVTTRETPTDSAPATAPAPDPAPATQPAPAVKPAGVVDLKTTFVSAGNIVGNTYKAGSIKRDSDGAVQFTIENIGTKTSGTWTYRVTLPDGDTYISPVQSPLLALERARISIGFPVDEDKNHTFVVTVAEAGDNNLSNNTDREEVTFIK